MIPSWAPPCAPMISMKVCGTECAVYTVHVHVHLYINVHVQVHVQVCTCTYKCTIHVVCNRHLLRNTLVPSTTCIHVHVCVTSTLSTLTLYPPVTMHEMGIVGVTNEIKVAIIIID